MAPPPLPHPLGAQHPLSVAAKWRRGGEDEEEPEEEEEEVEIGRPRQAIGLKLPGVEKMQ